MRAPWMAKVVATALVCDGSTPGKSTAARARQSVRNRVYRRIIAASLLPGHRFAAAWGVPVSFLLLFFLLASSLRAVSSLRAASFLQTSCFQASRSLLSLARLSCSSPRLSFLFLPAPCVLCRVRRAG